MIADAIADSLGIEVADMKFDATTIFFTMLLILTGTTLLLGSQAGVVSLDRMEPFWPLTIVATGMARLLNWRDKRQS